MSATKSKIALPVEVEPCPTIAIEGPTVHDGKEWWTTTKDYRYSLPINGSMGALTIASGFEHDGASVPRVLWRLFPPLSVYALAALVHDWLYKYRGKATLVNSAGATVDIEYTREQADAIFLRVMEYVGVKRWKRRTMWMGVRVGGPRW